jgi:hypothetical protein
MPPFPLKPFPPAPEHFQTHRLALCSGLGNCFRQTHPGWSILTGGCQPEPLLHLWNGSCERQPRYRLNLRTLQCSFEF